MDTQKTYRNKRHIFVIMESVFTSPVLRITKKKQKYDVEILSNAEFKRAKNLQEVKSLELSEDLFSFLNEKLDGMLLNLQRDGGLTRQKMQNLVYFGKINPEDSDYKKHEKEINDLYMSIIGK